MVIGTIEIFGEKLADQDYEIRMGCYAVILNDAKQFAAILTSRGHYFLPGGGIEFGEDPEECLRREVLEEPGYGIKNVSLIGQALFE